VNERPEETEGFNIRNRHLDGHALALGHLCFAWSHFEISIDSLLMSLVGIYGEDNGAELVTSHMNLDQKLQIIKGMGFLKKPSDEWLGKLFSVVKEIGKIKERRNHFVHAFYWPMEDADNRIFIMREESRTRLKKVKGEYAVGAEEVEVDPTEIWNLVHAIRDADEIISELWSIIFDANQHAAGER